MVMDRNDRPHRAKGLPQGYAGTFDTTATGTGGDDVAPPVDETRPENRIFDAGRRILADPDVMECAQYATVRLDAMIDRAAGPDETDDLPLIVENLRYDPEIPGGSRADYLAGHVLDAFRDTPVKARDREALEKETRAHILATALNPDRELGRLGMPPVRPDEHVGDDRLPETPYERAERRYQAALKGARTRQLRHDTAAARHLAPLDESMRALYRANVDRGLQSGSAFDDQMAFADTLAELQSDGWNPATGREYRKSKEFKKLEKQLLNGRKPTRRYRQMRDALCDDEREYRWFMESDPDVFDPDERIVKPFAGLGPDVGQAAMLRLAAKHRDVEGALQLARWDPSIEYTVPDAKNHTFRMEHDKPGIGYYSDGSTYPIGHTVITANGIKPASVMSWIHNEKPGTPEWEARTRTRFEESNGGEWKPAETDVI